MEKFVQKLIRWMPLILLILLFMVDRDIFLHKLAYIVLLLLYTIILIARILYAKENWHKEFSSDELVKDSKVKKMSDFESRLMQKEEQKID